MPSVLKKSPSGVSFSRGTLKWAAAKLKISSSVLSVVGIEILNYTSQITSRQIRLHPVVLHELPQPFLNRRLCKQVTENLDFTLQLVIRNRLHKLLCCNSSPPIELANLRSGSPRQSQCFSLRRDLADQAD